MHQSKVQILPERARSLSYWCTVFGEWLENLDDLFYRVIVSLIVSWVIATGAIDFCNYHVTVWRHGIICNVRAKNAFFAFDRHAVTQIFRAHDLIVRLVGSNHSHQHDTLDQYYCKRWCVGKRCLAIVHYNNTLDTYLWRVFIFSCPLYNPAAIIDSFCSIEPITMFDS